MKNTGGFLRTWKLPCLLLLAAVAVSILLERAAVAQIGPGADAYSKTLAQNTNTAPGFISEHANDGEDEEDSGNDAMRKASDVSKLLLEAMPQIHLLHKKFDAAMSPIAWTNYLDSLDFDRVYFTLEDIAEFELFRTQYHALMQEGDTSFAKIAFDRLRERVAQRVAFVEANVTNAFDFASSDSYTWKRKGMPWPANSEAQDALWRPRIANSILAQRVNTQIQNEKNEKKLAELRIAIAREMHEGATTSTNIPTEADLAPELVRFDAAIAALDSLPTNAPARYSLYLALTGAYAGQRPHPATNANETAASSTTNALAAVVAASTNAIQDVVAAATNALTDITKEAVAAIADAVTTASPSDWDAASTNAPADEIAAEAPAAIVHDATPTNTITSLISQYASTSKSIKTGEEAIADAAKKTLDNQKQFQNILNDSDEEFFLSRYFNAMTTAYDPHSGYLSPVSMEDFGIDMQLSLQGIGAQLQTEDGTAKVSEIIPGSPAERDTSETRLVPGDKIVGVAQGDEDFVDIRHWPLYKAVRLIRGPKGSTVRLQVIPANDAYGLKIVTLVRDEIKLEEQAASSRVETVTDENGAQRKLGYIKLPTFYSSMNFGSSPDVTPRSATLDVARLIAELNSEDVEGLILDLRSNGGGSLPEAVYLTGLFIRTGPVVQVKEARRTIPLPDNDPAIAFTKPLVVMVNRLSASASEIVAGALQDYGRAIVVGDSRTHGKGTVQTLVPLANGQLGSLKATTASFYRINGSSTQIRGVESDIRLPSIFEYISDLGEDKLNNPIPWSRTGPSRYRTVDSLADTIATLSARSAKRLDENEKWKDYREILERFGSFSTNTVLSLNYEERLAKAKDDDVLNRRVAESAGTGEDAAVDMMGDAANEPKPRLSKEEREANARKHDVVLDETLNVLVDFIDFHGPSQNLSEGTAPYDFLNSFFR